MDSAVTHRRGKNRPRYESDDDDNVMQEQHHPDAPHRDDLDLANGHGSESPRKKSKHETEPYVDPQKAHIRKKMQERRNIEKEQLANTMPPSPIAGGSGTGQGPSNVAANMSMIMNLFRQRKIQMRNAFQTDTVLDAMKDVDVKNEPLADMAMALDSATLVYGYRVDNAHLDMYDTRSAFSRGKAQLTGGATQLAERNKDGVDGEEEEREQENGEVPKKKRKKDKDDESRHNRMADLMDRVGGALGEDDTHDGESGGSGESTDTSDNDSDNDEEKATPPPQPKPSTFTWHPNDDILVRLEEDLQQRREKVDKMSGRTNSKIVSDSESLHLKRREHRENPYYSKVVYNVTRKRMGGLFLYNAETTEDGRRLMLHPRGEPTRPSTFHKYSKDFLGSIAGLCDWGLSKNPKPFPRDLLPATSITNKNKVLGNLGAINEEEDEEYEIENDEQDVLINQREEDDTIMPDRTIMDGAVMGNQTLAFRGGHTGTKRVTLKGLGEKQIRIPDRLPGLRGMDPSVAIGLSGMLRRKLDPEEPEKEFRMGREAEEFNLETVDRNDAEMQEKDIAHVCDIGLGTIMRDFEHLWHSQYAKVTVTREDEQIELKRCREETTNMRQRRLLEQRVLKPGKYKMFVAPPDYPRNYPRDPAANDIDGLDDDDYMSGCGDGMEMDYDQATPMPIGDQLLGHNESFNVDPADQMHDDAIEAEQAIADDVEAANRIAEEERQRALLLDEGGEGVAAEDGEGEKKERPIDEGEEALELMAPQINVNPDEALKHIGKADDAHWKFGKEEEKLGKKKKVKKEDGVKHSDEHYFISDLGDLEYMPDGEGGEMYKSPLHRLETVDKEQCKSLIHVNPEKVFMKRRRAERHIQLSYDFENFAKPCLLFKGRYGLLRVERPSQKQRRDSQEPKVNQFASICNAHFDNEEEEGENVYFEFLKTFSDFKFEVDDSNNRTVMDVPDQPWEADDGMPVDCGDDMDDSFHDAVDFLGLNDESGEEMKKQRQTKREQARHLREQRLEEDDEIPTHDLTQNADCNRQILEEMLELAKRAKQQRVDTLQVKVAMKGLLSNKYLSDRALLTVSKHIKLPSEDKENDQEKSPQEKDKAEFSGAEDNSEIMHDALEEQEESGGVQRDGEPRGESVRDGEEEEMEELDAHEAAIAEQEISRALNAPPVDLEIEEVIEMEGAEDAPETLNASLRVTNFAIEGEHSFASVFSCLPHRLPPQDANVHVATALVIALHMCNENDLICEQARPDGSEDVGSANWMTNFVFRNQDGSSL